MKKTIFLDLSLDMQSGNHAPFRKKNNDIKYIYTDSNHPNAITRQIPKMISKRLSSQSINQEEFLKTSEPYDALARSVYEEKIE